MRMRCIRPWLFDYVLRARAQREADNAAFRKRRDAAVAKLAVEEQGVGE